MTESDIHGLTFAVLALSFTPFAYWQLGPRRGYREGGLSLIAGAVYVAVWGILMLLSIVEMSHA